MQRIYTIYAKWDDKAQVWFVDHSDIPGLVTEAPTQEQFIQHIRELAPELIALDDLDQQEVPVELLWSGGQKLSIATGRVAEIRVNRP